MPRPCQHGYKCIWADRQPGVVVCRLPRCALTKVRGKDGVYVDRICKVTVKV